MNPLVTRPQWKFRLEPKLKDALLKLQNDRVRSSRDVDHDFGMPVQRKQQNPVFVNSYVNVSSKSSITPQSVSSVPLFNSFPSSEASPGRPWSAPPLSSQALHRIFAVGLVGGSALFWTWKLVSVKRRPSEASEAVASRRLAEAQTQRDAVEAEKTYITSFTK